MKLLRWLGLAVVVTALLVPAATVTAVRLLDPLGGFWVRLVSFTPQAGVLYLLALLVLVVACLRGRGAWRGVALALAVLALAGVALHGHWARGPFLGGRPAASAAPLHVMTSNLRAGEADTGRVVRLALDHDVDVLVLQEVTPQALRRLRDAGLGKALPEHAGRAEPGTHGTMVFASAPLTRVRRLPTEFACYSMDVRLRGVRGPVHLVAVHPRPPTGDATGWWADQRVIGRAAQGRRPALVVGDLNATMDHAPMRELVGRGYRDAATEARSRWQPTWPAAGEVSVLGLPVPSFVAIDHVLVNGGAAGNLRTVRTESFTVVGTDHRTLVAALDP